MLTKYVVGAKANPPKKLRRPLKNGNVMPTNIVNAANNEHIDFNAIDHNPSNILVDREVSLILTNIYVPRDEPKGSAGFEMQFLYQDSFYHIKHWHSINLHEGTQNHELEERFETTELGGFGTAPDSFQ